MSYEQEQQLGQALWDDFGAISDVEVEGDDESDGEIEVTVIEIAKNETQVQEEEEQEEANLVLTDNDVFFLLTQIMLDISKKCENKFRKYNYPSTRGEKHCKKSSHSFGRLVFIFYRRDAE